MATPRARGGSSLTISPPIKRSPLVCCSSPQMMRRYVVLPQPDGPSSTMNSPFGTSKLMPLTAGTSPNFLTMFLVDTAAIEPPRIQHEAPAPPISRRRFVTCFPASEPASHTPARPDRVRPRHAIRSFVSGLAGPLLHDGLALCSGPLDRLFGARLTGRRLRHHVIEDELVVNFVHRRRGRAGIARDGGPLVRVLQDLQLVLRGRSRIVREDRHRLGHKAGKARIVIALACLEGFRPIRRVVPEELLRGFLVLGEFPDAVELGRGTHEPFHGAFWRLNDEDVIGQLLVLLLCRPVSRDRVDDVRADAGGDVLIVAGIVP